jgi:putative hydrolase of the HAD superfamily
MIDIDYVIWDFDGVVNANVVDGHFIWIDNFKTDIGHSPEVFAEQVFNHEFDQVLRGEKDVIDQLREWAAHVQLSGSIQEIYNYWLTSDCHVDDRILGVMDDVRTAGVGNAIGTNNDPRRAKYIEREMGLGAHIEHMFAAGRMGVLKPDAAFFEHISDALQVAPDRLILIDDLAENVESAAQAGWHAHQFTGLDYAGLEARLGLD